MDGVKVEGVGVWEMSDQSVVALYEEMGKDFYPHFLQPPFENIG